MEIVGIVVVCVLAVAGANQLAPRVRIAAPLLLVGFGVAVSYLPGVPPIWVDPEVVLIGVLPPLLYAAAVALPAMDFKRDFQAISGLSIVLVVISALLLGLLFMLILPDADYATGVALGAILSPTDAVATTTVKRVGAPQRLITVLSGESLFNDASALVVLRAAIAAMAGGLSMVGVALSFVWAIIGAVIVGGAVGWVFIVARARISNAAVATAVSFTAPYIAYVPTEIMGASGLVAAVAAGLVTGRGSVRRLTAAHRQSDQQTWRTVELLLEGGVFLLMGLELKALVMDVTASHESVIHAFWPAAIAFVLLMVIRWGFVMTLVAAISRRSRRVIAREPILEQMQDRLGDPDAAADRLTRRFQRRIDRRLADIEYYRTESIGFREGHVVVWAGMRGVVTLAAAQTLPADTPYRSLLVLVAFVVATGSLMIQGSTLGAFIKWMRLPDHRADAARELQRLNREMASISVEVLTDPAVCSDSMLARNVEQVRSLEASDDGDPTGDVLDRRLRNAVEMRRVRRVIIDRQRAELIDLRDRGAYSSEALTSALARLDAEEISLDAQANR
ncbi:MULTISPECIES: cation:proton antiporter [Gordonia]|uniref:Putative solute/hydrogen antiporter n=1 Tax=Gordonia sihwensis NBRC 108236 TaxID=1223544 RepID=L7LEI2_9ACTN|nr:MULTISPECIES: cation:proton antiporter [Gordonia]AUH70487.1 cation:proton antiporter [Gordonia sp. YC-JH1]KJR08796.1 solute:hydrogen antiporter [Gordonia sihwensis]MBY4571516.1 cation:proton antiporter [Gordonia sihwensis]GAC59530.1 putative solute/hydrogen antiporter [Gordonia sihwensis NBRC 108236]